MLNRFDRENASRKVREYYWPKPHEAALGQKEDPFNRAKQETLSYMRKAIQNVEALTLEEFLLELKSGRVMKSVEALTPFWGEAPATVDAPSKVEEA